MITVPEWINQDITPADIAAINQGGCASGAYMSAVTYSVALEVMHNHGDDVTEYLHDTLGDMPDLASSNVFRMDWSGIAVYYLSCAVEVWASSMIDLEDWDNDTPIREMD